MEMHTIVSSVKSSMYVLFVFLLCSGVGHAAVIDFSNAAQSVNEGILTATVDVEIQGGIATGTDVIVDFTIGGTATGGGVDYTMSHAGQITLIDPITSGTITFTINTADLYNEFDETVVLTMTTISGGHNAGVGTHTLTIVDDDPLPNVSIALTNPTFPENGGEVYVKGTLSTPSGRDVSVNLSFAGAATPTIDFNGPNILTITAGQQNDSITLTAINDLINEVSESIIVGITSIDYGNELGGAGTQQDSTQISDDDGVPSVTISVDNPSVSENGGLSTTTATLSNPSGVDVVVKLGFSGTATMTTDYTTTADSIIIVAGNTTGSIDITGVSEGLFEIDETVIVDVISIVDGLATENGIQRDSVTLLESTGQPEVVLSLGTTTVAEGINTTLTATLLSTSTVPVVVDFSFGGSATRGITDDYIVTDSSITIAAGSTFGSITINTKNDTLVEREDTVAVSISSITGGVESGGAGAQDIELYITSDDVATVTFVTRSTFTNEGVGTLWVPVQLDNVSYQDVTVTFGFSGTAVEGAADDFTLIGGVGGLGQQVIISAGSLRDSIGIVFFDNALYELTESIVISITDVTNANNGGLTRYYNVMDNEPKPHHNIYQDTTVSEGDGVVEVPVTIDQIASMDLKVYFRTAGLATKGAGGDYTVEASPVTIPSGSLSTTISITLVDDSRYEPSQPFNLIIDSVSNASRLTIDTICVVTIDDDDSPPDVTLTAQDSISENGGVSIITAILSETSEYVTMVNVGATGVDSVPVQYVFDATAIMIPAGSLSATTKLRAIDNNDDEQNGGVTVEVVSVTNGVESVPQAVPITILDEDSPKVSISHINNPRPFELNGVAAVWYSMNKPSWQNIVVYLSYTGVAKKGIDYIAPDSIVIPAGAVLVFDSITGVDDPFDEDDYEIIKINIDSVKNGTENGAQVDSAWVTDNDATPTIDFTDPSSTVAEAVGMTTIQVDVSAVSNKDIIIYYGKSGSAEAGGVDYTASPYPLIIPAGSLSETIDITITGDVIDEDNEYALISLDSIKNGDVGIVGSHQMNIIDDDIASIYLGIDKPGIKENGGTVNITASLTIPANQNVTVYLGYAGVATFGVDYIADTVIVIPAGDISASIALVAIDDGTGDVGVETIEISVDSVINGIDASSLQTVNIEDAVTPQLSITIDKTSVNESNDSVRYTAKIDIASAQDVVFDLLVSGTATDGEDYTMIKKITIPKGQIAFTTYLVPINDPNDEPLETITIAIDTATMVNCAEAGGVGTETKTIQLIDNDIPEITLVTTNNPLFENGGEATITAVLSGLSWQDITINLSFDGSALDTIDYIRSDTVIVIPSGSLSRSITIIGVDDLYDEYDETVLVDVNGVINGIHDGNQLQTVGITDDDATPEIRLTIDKDTLVEDAGETVTVYAQLSKPSGREVEVVVNVSGTADQGAMFDYLGVDSVFTIPALSLKDSITFTTVIDAVNEEHESIVFTVTSVVNALDSSTVQTVVIKDDDKPKVTLSLSQDTLRENQNDTLTQYEVGMEIQASLSILSFQDVWVYLEVAGGVDSADYVLSDSIIMIPAGSNQAKVSFITRDDFDCENDEAITISIKNLVNGKYNGDSTAQIRSAMLLNDDLDPEISLMASNPSISENGDTTYLIAQLSAKTWRPVSADISFGGGAVVDVDYSRSAASVLIPAGELADTITIIGIDDDLDLPSLGLTLAFVAPPINATESTVQTANITITSDDTPMVSMAIDATEIDEGGGVAGVSLSMQRVSWQDVTVFIKYDALSSAFRLSDYTGALSAVIPAGSLTASFPITAIDDINDEGNEDIMFTIDSVTNALENGSQSGRITIIENDFAPVLADTVLYLSEDSPGGTVVGTVVAVDDQDTLIYTIRGGNSDALNDTLFSIDSLTGAIALVSGAQIDYERKSLYNLSVTVTDRQTNPKPGSTISIQLNNINDNAPVMGDDTLYIAENASNNTFFGTLAATDADSNTLSYRILSGNEASVFALRGSDSLMLIDSAAVNYNFVQEFLISIEASDGLFSDTSIVIIGVTDVNYTPSLIVDSSAIELKAYSAIGTVITQVYGVDDDLNTIFSYAITDGNKAGKFMINNEGAIQLVSIVEPGNVYPLQVTVYDQDSSSAQQNITIYITGIKDTIDHNLSGQQIDTTDSSGEVVINPPVVNVPVIDYDPVTGNTRERYPDGTVVVYSPNGDETTIPVSGNTWKVTADGSITEYLANGCYKVNTRAGVAVTNPVEECPDVTPLYNTASRNVYDKHRVVNTRTFGVFVVPGGISKIVLRDMRGRLVGTRLVVSGEVIEFSEVVKPGIYVMSLSR